MKTAEERRLSAENAGLRTEIAELLEKINGMRDRCCEAMEKMENRVCVCPMPRGDK